MVVRKQSRLRCSFSLMALLLVLLIMVTSAPATAGTAGQAKVDRLVMGLITPYLDYTRPWINGTADHNIQHDPMLEWLFEVDAETGRILPWLAEKATLGPDGRSWTIQLRKGVQFHHGFGEFTGKDVIHNHALWCDDNYPGRKRSPELRLSRRKKKKKKGKIKNFLLTSSYAGERAHDGPLQGGSLPLEATTPHTLLSLSLGLGIPHVTPLLCLVADGASRGYPPLTSGEMPNRRPGSRPCTGRFPRPGSTLNIAATTP